MGWDALLVPANNIILVWNGLTGTYKKIKSLRGERLTLLKACTLWGSVIHAANICFPVSPYINVTYDEKINNISKNKLFLKITIQQDVPK